MCVTLSHTRLDAKHTYDISVCLTSQHVLIYVGVWHQIRKVRVIIPIGLTIRFPNRASCHASVLQYALFHDTIIIPKATV